MFSVPHEDGSWNRWSEPDSVRFHRVTRNRSRRADGIHYLPDETEIVPERRDVHVDYQIRIWIMVPFNWQPSLGLNSRITAMFPEVIGLDQSPSVYNKDSLVRTSGWSGNVGVLKKEGFLNDISYAAELVTNQNLADAAIASSRADDAKGSYMYMLTLGDQVTCSANCVLTIMMETGVGRCALKCGRWLFVTCCAWKGFLSLSEINTTAPVRWHVSEMWSAIN
jgi:hypothetical protein